MKTKIAPRRFPWAGYDRTRLACLAVFCLFLAAGPTAGEESAPPPLKVMVDAGHGGEDAGVRGDAGALEKSVSLELARALAALPRDRLEILLTRREDRPLDLFQRTALANHAGADLFISLHAGAGPLRQTSGITIYYHDPDHSLPPLLPAVPADGRTGGDYPSWEQIQKAHYRASRTLADTVRAYLARRSDLPIPRVHGAPLAVLAGADMPAILIEVGHLTNPEQARALQDPAFLADLARLMAQAIIAFADRQPAPQAFGENK